VWRHRVGHRGWTTWDELRSGRPTGLDIASWCCKLRHLTVRLLRVLGALILDIVSETADVLLCYASVSSSISLAENLAYTVIVRQLR
jgi:hypothetical protein